MSILESTVTIGDVDLEGELTTKDVESLLQKQYYKSWLYLLDAGTPSNPENLLKDAGIAYENVPVPMPHGLTGEAASRAVAALKQLPRPIMVQCGSGARASAVLLMHKAETLGLPAEKVDELGDLLGLSCTKKPPLMNWAKNYLGQATGALVFRQLFDSGSSTYTYLLADKDTSEAVLIDPVLEKVDRDVQLIKEMDLKLLYAINTHCHADHVTGTGKLKSLLSGVKSGISAASGAKADIHYQHGDQINFGNLELEVLSTPGHTNGCVSYYLKHGKGRIFTGDAVLVRGCGRTDFQEGNSEVLYDSVHKHVFSLPDDTIIYPAHDYKGRTCTSVREEKLHNPRLTKSKEEFVQIMKNLNLSYPAKIDVALPANLVCGILDD